MKNILITGGVGFIGANLAEELVKQKYNVISLDYYSFGSKENEIKGFTGQLYTVDAEKHWIKNSEDKLPFDLKKYVTFHYSSFFKFITIA